MPQDTASRSLPGLSALLLAGCCLAVEGCGECIDCTRAGPDPAYAAVTVLDTAGAPVTGIAVELGGSLAGAACSVSDAAGHSTCLVYLGGRDSVAAWIRTAPGSPYHPDSALAVFRQADTARVTLSIGG